MRTITATLLLAFLLLLVATLQRRSPVLEIQNASEEAVSAVEIEVGGRHARLTGIAAGDSRQQALPLHADGPLRVRVRFQSGATVTRQGGYLTPGMMGSNRLQIESPDSITVTTR